MRRSKRSSHWKGTSVHIQVHRAPLSTLSFCSRSPWHPSRSGIPEDGEKLVFFSGLVQSAYKYRRPHFRDWTFPQDPQGISTWNIERPEKLVFLSRPSVVLAQLAVRCPISSPIFMDRIVGASSSPHSFGLGSVSDPYMATRRSEVVASQNSLILLHFLSSCRLQAR